MIEGGLSISRTTYSILLIDFEAFGGFRFKSFWLMNPEFSIL